MLEADHYALLEIPPDANTDQVRQAYFRLAKVYHPDRQAAEDAEATERFLAIQTAYEVLSNRQRREDYDARRISAGRGPAAKTAEPEATASSKPAKAGKSAKPAAKAEEAPKSSQPTLAEERDARMGFMKSTDLLERGDYENALRVMKAVVRAVPNRPEYISTLGYVMALNGERLHAARDYCRKAVEAEPYNPDFLAHLGYVYQEAGLKKTADRFFAEALEKNPRQPVARAATGGGEGQGGLLGGLKRLLNRKV